MKPLPKNKRLLLQKKKLLLQKTMRGELEKLREMVSNLLGQETAMAPPQGSKASLLGGRRRAWRRKL